MSPSNLVIIAVVVFILMFVGLILTVLEFRSGAPKAQIDDKDKMQESPHGHID